MLSAARYFSPGPGAAFRTSQTSSTLSTTGSFHGLVRNCMYRFISSRPQVTPKKNRSEMMRTLKVVAETSALVMSS
jgi:hypothetical protein